MKYFSILFALLCTILIGGCSAQKDTAVPDAELGITNLRQLVADDNAAARTIMWQADKQKNFTLHYRKKDTDTAQNIPAEDVSFTVGQQTYYQYKVKLQHLETATTYEYQLSDGEKTGTWHKLTTDNGKNFTAIIFPDSQSSDYSSWQSLAAAAHQAQPQADFFISMGDLVDNGADHYQWQQWFKGINGFAADIPLAPVMGNHETYTMDWKTQLPYLYTNLFSLPSNGLAQYQNQFYSFDYGPVHFVVLDTQADELQKLQPNLTQEQLSWLHKDLATNTAPWTIVLQHRDILLYEFNKRPGSTTHFIDIGHIYMPVFEEYDIDLVLSAHLHTYRRRVPLKNFQPDPDGITYVLTGIAGNVMYPGLWKNSSLDAAAGPDGDKTNYLTLQADEHSLQLRAYTADGQQFDEYVMTK